MRRKNENKVILFLLFPLLRLDGVRKSNHSQIHCIRKTKEGTIRTE